MKNLSIKVLLSILLVIIISNLQAQEGFWYGFSLGAQNTYLHSKVKSNIDSKNAIRPVSILDIEYRFTPKFALQTGIGYSLLTQNTSKFNNNFNYLTIPLYLRGGGFKGDKKKWAISYFAGMNFNILLSAKNLYQGEKKDIDGYTNKLLRNFVVGCGVKYKIKENLLLEAHLISSFGRPINQSSTNGFILTNINYGGMISLKYQFKKRPK